jgi:AraC-like DNA-binding protein
MSDQFRIIASVYRGLIEILKEEGLSPDQLSKAVGSNIQVLTTPNAILSLEQVSTLWELGYKMRGETIGLDVALRIRLVDFQDVGVFLTATEDAGDLIKQLANYSALFSNVMELQAKESESGIEVKILYNANVDMAYERLDFLSMAGQVLVSQYLESPLKLEKVELTRPKPIDTSPWDHAFGVKVQWNAPITRYCVNHEEAHRLVLTRNQHLRKELKTILDQRLRQDKEAHPLDEIRTVMTKLSVQQTPNMYLVADALHISTRTLQRRLQDEKTNFNDLLSTIRRDMAKHYLGLGLSTGEVAEKLGYADANAFSRAFRRWTDLTPSQYVKQL